MPGPTLQPKVATQESLPTLPDTRPGAAANDGVGQGHIGCSNKCCNPDVPPGKKSPLGKLAKQDQGLKRDKIQDPVKDVPREALQPHVTQVQVAAANTTAKVVTVPIGNELVQVRPAAAKATSSQPQSIKIESAETFKGGSSSSMARTFEQPEQKRGALDASSAVTTQSSFAASAFGPSVEMSRMVKSDLLKSGDTPAERFSTEERSRIRKDTPNPATSRSEEAQSVDLRSERVQSSFKSEERVRVAAVKEFVAGQPIQSASDKVHMDATALQASAITKTTAPNALSLPRETQGSSRNRIEIQRVETAHTRLENVNTSSGKQPSTVRVEPHINFRAEAVVPKEQKVVSERLSSDAHGQRVPFRSIESPTVQMTEVKKQPFATKVAAPTSLKTETLLASSKSLAALSESRKAPVTVSNRAVTNEMHTPREEARRLNGKPEQHLFNRTKVGNSVDSPSRMKDQSTRSGNRPTEISRVVANVRKSVNPGPVSASEAFHKRPAANTGSKASTSSLTKAQRNVSERVALRKDSGASISRSNGHESNRVSGISQRHPQVRSESLNIQVSASSTRGGVTRSQVNDSQKLGGNPKLQNERMLKRDGRLPDSRVSRSIESGKSNRVEISRTGLRVRPTQSRIRGGAGLLDLQLMQDLRRKLEELEEQFLEYSVKHSRPGRATTRELLRKAKRIRARQHIKRLEQLNGSRGKADTENKAEALQSETSAKGAKTATTQHKQKAASQTPTKSLHTVLVKADDEDAQNAEDNISETE